MAKGRKKGNSPPSGLAARSKKKRKERTRRKEEGKGKTVVP